MAPKCIAKQKPIERRGQKKQTTKQNPQGAKKILNRHYIEFDFKLLKMKESLKLSPPFESSKDVHEEGFFVII